MSDRRGFLRGFVTLPLIGGGVTLIGRPAAAVPLIQAVAAPDLLGDPRQRARYAWEAFAAAMRDLTADAPGWRVVGGNGVRFRDEVAYLPWMRVHRIYLEPMFPDQPHNRSLIEQDEEFRL